MKFVTYRATPGLEQFPELERFRVWGAVHKGLMRTDPNYKRTVRRFQWRILAMTILFLVPSLAVGRLSWPSLWVQVPAYLVLAFIYLLYDLHSSFSVQGFMNEKVGEALHEHPFERVATMKKPLSIRVQAVALIIMGVVFYLVDCFVAHQRNPEVAWIKSGFYNWGPVGFLASATCILVGVYFLIAKR